MKKVLAVFAIAAIAISAVATPVLAKDGHDSEKENRGFSLGKIFSVFRSDDDHDDLASNQFMLTGTVGSKTSGSIVVNVKASVQVPTLTNNLATVNVDSNTKITGKKNQSLVLADIAVNDMVMVTGTFSGSTLTAQKIVDMNFDQSNEFMIKGTIASISGSNVVLNVTKSSGKAPEPVNNQSTVVTSSSTKIKANKHQTVALADLKAGMEVKVQGSVNGTTLNARQIEVKFAKGKVYGEVTAKTDTSVTVKNAVTGITQTISTDADTKVNINGEAKAVTDIQVGDKGFVKFRTTLAGMFAKVINLFR